MAFRGTIKGVRLAGAPRTRQHWLHVYDEGLVLGPGADFNVGVQTLLVCMAMFCAVPMCGGLAAQQWAFFAIGLLMMAVAIGTLVAMAVQRWQTLRAGPPPATTAPEEFVRQTPGSGFIPTSEITQAVPGHYTTTSTTYVNDVPQTSYHHFETLTISMRSGATAQITGPRGMLAYIGYYSLRRQVITDPALLPRHEPRTTPSYPMAAMPRVVSGRYPPGLGERIG